MLRTKIRYPSIHGNARAKCAIVVVRYQKKKRLLNKQPAPPYISKRLILRGLQNRAIGFVARGGRPVLPSFLVKDGVHLVALF
jgi:hypothetical protein